MVILSLKISYIVALSAFASFLKLLMVVAPDAFYVLFLVRLLLVDAVNKYFLAFHRVIVFCFMIVCIYKEIIV